MAVWGLTGGIGAGKSTAADVLRKLGIPVLDMDAVAADLMKPGTDVFATKPGTDVFATIAAEFGPGVINPDGTLNRKALAGIIFTDADRRKRLEQIVHPPTICETMRRLDNYAVKKSSFIFIESALIFAVGLDKQLQGTAVVTAPAEVRLNRVITRDGAGRTDVEKRMAAQLDETTAREKATVIWDNSGSLDDLRRQIVELVARQSA